ncbi:MAG: hypothetical protein HYU74_03995 [Dechloromonas sp.]|nr:hypothetical protein [Dechloromonas sp.]
MFLASFPEFLNYCRSVRGETLHTGARNKPFSVEVEGGALWFVPLSSGKRRRASPEKTEQVLSLLNKTGSCAPGSYHAITFHASYILAVANKHAKKPA